jgi:hypothetical protein
MKTLYRIVVVGLVVLLPAQGWGLGNWDDVKGSALLDGCLAANPEMEGQRLGPEAQARSAYCLGRVEAFLATHFLAIDLAGMVPWFCVPTGVTVGQGIRVVVRYLHAHPEQGGWPGTFVTFLALKEAFPCQPPAPSPAPR